MLSKGNLLKRYWLQHATFGHGQSQSCLYDCCDCTFKSQNALRTHLSRCHAAEESLQSGIMSSFKCLVCDACCSTEKDYIRHIGNHLKSHKIHQSFVYLNNATFWWICTIHSWNAQAENTNPILWVILSKTCMRVTIIRLLTILIYQRPVIVRALVWIVIRKVHQT